MRIRRFVAVLALAAAGAFAFSGVAQAAVAPTMTHDKVDMTHDSLDMTHD